MFPAEPTILCVDDEKPNLKLLEAILAPRGYNVITASSGSEALDIIMSGKIDLVLLDVMMPDLDGFEVCRRIKEDKSRSDLPVVMITALTLKEDRIRGIEAGAEDFISKPFDKNEVIARIKMLLRMKDLHDRLNFAYNNITSLTFFGEDTINSFDPLDFDYMDKIDSMVGKIIRQKAEMSENPEMILARLASEKKRSEWYLHRFISGDIVKSRLPLNFPLRLPSKERSETFYLNEPAAGETMIYPLAEKLKSFDIRITNAVGYVSSELCIFALNYGRAVGAHDASVLSALATQCRFLKSLSAQVRETEGAFIYTVHALARAAEANDEDTGNHIMRVGMYSAILAGQIGMPAKFVELVRTQAPLHDVGKIHTHPDILRKPGKLTAEEWEEMKRHTIYGSKIVGEHPVFRTARNIALTHHERWDGSGYPSGLKGEQIPLEGRILSVADQYDALRNARSYKPAFDHRTAYEIITKGDGRTMPVHFDPAVVGAFEKVHSRFAEVYEELKN